MVRQSAQLSSETIAASELVEGNHPVGSHRPGLCPLRNRPLSFLKLIRAITATMRRLIAMASGYYAVILPHLIMRS